MAVSKLSQLNAGSWISSSNPLMKSYREYAEKGTAPSKGRLALSATVNAVQTVAYAIIAAVGLAIYCVSFGNIQNKPWHYACLHAEMTKESISALFHFKPAMEKLRVAEAQAYCRSALNGGDRLELFLDSKQVRWPEIGADLSTKLKKLDAAQLKEVLQTRNHGSFRSARDFLEILHQLRKEATEEKQPVFNGKIADMQQKLYREYKLITCISEESGWGILFYRGNRKEGLELLWPELKQKLEAVEKSEGAEVLALTKEQYAFCAGFGPVHDLLKPENPILPAPALLETMLKLAREKGWNDVVDQVKSSCQSYVKLLEEGKRPYTREEIASLARLSKLVENLHLMKACLHHRANALKNEPAKTPDHVKELAQLSFEYLKANYARAYLTPAEAENCLNALLEDPTMAWMTDKEGDADAVISAIQKMGNATEMGARFIEMSLTSGKLTVLNRMPAIARTLFNSTIDERLTNAWQNCPNQAVRNQAMPALYTLSFGWSWNGNKAHPNCPKLIDAIFAYAKTPAILNAAKKECQEVLKLPVYKGAAGAVGGAFGHANIDLKPQVLERLPLIQQYNLEQLRDNCVDIILTNAGQFAAIWLNEQSDLIADALNKTKRRADWVQDRLGESQLACAKEGMALLEYSLAHAATPLAVACKDYLLRSPNNAAYLTAVRALDAQQRANYKILEDLYK